jgi:hypothetical protein
MALCTTLNDVDVVNGTVHGAVNGTVHGAVNDAVHDGVNGTVHGAVNDAVNSAEHGAEHAAWRSAWDPRLVPPDPIPQPPDAHSKQPDPAGSRRIPPDPAGSRRIPPDPVSSRRVAGASDGGNRGLRASTTWPAGGSAYDNRRAEIGVCVVVRGEGKVGSGGDMRGIRWGHRWDISRDNWGGTRGVGFNCWDLAGSLGLI